MEMHPALAEAVAKRKSEDLAEEREAAIECFKQVFDIDPTQAEDYAEDDPNFVAYSELWSFGSDEGVRFLKVWRKRRLLSNWVSIHDHQDYEKLVQRTPPTFAREYHGTWREYHGT